MRRLIVRSRNRSCAPLRNIMTRCRVIYRMGSTTPTEEIIRNPRIRNNYRIIEINSVKACKISGDKILMKKRFDHARVRTAKWFTVSYNDHNAERFMYYLTKWGTNIIAKHKHSSKGNDIFLLKDINDYYLLRERQGRRIEQFVFERYYSYSREYRIHISKYGCFYACRKMLITNAEDRWHRHSNNSVFIFEDNPQFNKPDNWDEIVNDCMNAMKSIGLDIAAFDVKVSLNGKYIILESNSAPSLKETGIQKYSQELMKIINGI